MNRHKNHNFTPPCGTTGSLNRENQSTLILAAAAPRSARQSTEFLVEALSEVIDRFLRHPFANECGDDVRHLRLRLRIARACEIRREMGDGCP